MSRLRCSFALWSAGLLTVLGGTRPASAGHVVFARNLALSPDGGTLAFSWAGDIWAVPSTGGQARRLTVHPADDSHPVWSRDGQWIAFDSDRHGAPNVFVMRADGTDVRRLTFSDQAEVPTDWSPDGQFVYFQSRREGDPARDPRLYRVPVAGGQPWRAVDCFGAWGRLSPNGRRLAFTRGTSEWWRRGYRGSGNPDIWVWDIDTDDFTQVTDFSGMDRQPFWGPGGSGLYFLSDRGGTVNVWYQPLGDRPAEQITQMNRADVRDLAVSADGRTLAFTHWDELYVLSTADRRARAIEVIAGDDTPRNEAALQTFTKDADEQAVSPDGKEIALVINGEIFVIKAEENRLTRRVTNSPARDQEITWSPDGKALFFVSDSSGHEEIYRALSAEEPPRALSDSQLFKIEPVTANAALEYGPDVSPDGKSLAYVRGRGELIVRDLKTGAEHTLVSGWDRPVFRWSPDSKWLAYQIEDDENNADIWIVPADGSKPAVNISQHPDNDVNPQWSADGQVLAFSSRRDGFDRDLYLVFLSPALDEKSPVALDEYFQKQAEEVKKRKPVKSAVASGKIVLAGEAAATPPAESQPAASQPASTQATTKPADLAKAARAELRKWLKDLLEEPGAKKKEKGKDGEKDEKKAEKAETYEYELETAYRRIRRVTSLPGDQGDFALAPDGQSLVFRSSHEGEAKLYSIKWNGEDIKSIVSAGVNSLAWTLDGKRLHFLKGGVPTACGPGGSDSKTYKFRAKLVVDFALQAAQKFDDGARQIELRFYHPTMKGLDWPALTRKYRELALQTRTIAEFNEIFDMLLGELNASHMGIFGPDRGSKEQVGNLGVTLDRTFPGPGLKVADVVPRSPAARNESKLVPGDILLTINGEAVGPDHALEQALIDTVGDEVVIEFVPSPDREPEKESKPAPPREKTEPADEPKTGPDEPTNTATSDEPKPAPEEKADRKDATPTSAPASAPASQPARRKLVIRPCNAGTLNNLKYDAWVAANEKYVNEQTSGRVGYLHIRGMDAGSFQVFERDLYAAAHGKDGLIIDVRNNGGGWTADWVLAVLNVRRHAYTVSRGGQPGYPHDRLVFYAWTKPATMMCNENSFSNAEILSHAFKNLKRGPLVGMTTYGGVISTGSYQLLDGATVRMPGRGWFTLDGTDMENHGAEPDVKVAIRPADEVHGRRPQLDAAIEATRAQIAQPGAQP